MTQLLKESCLLQSKAWGTTSSKNATLATFCRSLDRESQTTWAVAKVASRATDGCKLVKSESKVLSMALH